jgi:hypothetical protein
MGIGVAPLRWRGAEHASEREAPAVEEHDDRKEYVGGVERRPA